MTEERTAFIPSPKGRGVFCLLFYNKILLDGVFSALDVLYEAVKHYLSDRPLWKDETSPILNQRVEVCMRCGFIYGEATDLQKRLWGIHQEG